ncbi:MAG: hypothetical protein Hyperionvirus24_25 [Hyperionvirus sp.]|uniref:Uncharacterized protein n=1 Tax=Hyperionvirus sp. TaxID=2487770 RepID=A0A3G5AEU1_9VIRU|nr:MAG: hypothetical protein Hyperionvirus24_25 [Hyperionvirus sp.]
MDHHGVPIVCGGGACGLIAAKFMQMKIAAPVNPDFSAPSTGGFHGDAHVTVTPTTHTESGSVGYHGPAGSVTVGGSNTCVTHGPCTPAITVGGTIKF